MFTCLFLFHFHIILLVALGEQILHPAMIIHGCGGGCDAYALRFCLGTSCSGEHMMEEHSIFGVVFLELVGKRLPMRHVVHPCLLKGLPNASLI